nr:cysteine proteinase 15a [Quercus suber]
MVSLDGDDDLLLHAEHHFSSFKARFGKSYGSVEEHDFRFGVFNANLRRAKIHQKLDQRALSTNAGLVDCLEPTQKGMQISTKALWRKLQPPRERERLPFLF